MEERTLAFRVEEELHRTLKVKLANEGITLKDYVIGLIKSDLYNNERPISADDLRSYANAINEASAKILAMVPEQPNSSENS